MTSSSSSIPGFSISFAIAVSLLCLFASNGSEGNWKGSIKEVWMDVAISCDIAALADASSLTSEEE